MHPGFHCTTCGKWHQELPLNLAFHEPEYVVRLNAQERARCVTGQAGTDFRVLHLAEGETNYFIRGVLELPIRGTDTVFAYGVWASLSPASFKRAVRAYNDNTSAGPFFGWISNRLPGYPDTLALKSEVSVRQTLKSTILLEPTDHPLSKEQHEGITMERVHEIVHFIDELRERSA